MIKKIGIVILSFLVSQSTVFAAGLSFSPGSGTYNKNASFSVSVYVTSPDQAMNAASATITFPTSTLQVASISKTGSIVDFWAQEPTFSNTTGQIKFEGVVLTPGYTGSSGKLLTINFKGKAVGTAALALTGSSVLANDGTGSNILTTVGNGSFIIKEAPPEEPDVIELEDLEPVEEVTTEEVCEPDSIITSSTHPGVVWRRENTAAFSWDLPEGILASKIAFDKSPVTEPTTINSPPIVEKRYENLEDGIWYFHLALQTNNGWKETEHFKIKIDHTPPSIEAREIKRSDLTDPRPVIALSVADAISCVKTIELSINGDVLEYEKLASGDLRLETIDPGEHELVITAYDRAGNKNEIFVPIVVEALAVPEVTDYPAEINVGETLTVKGETIPNGNVEAKVTSKRNNFLIREEFQSASGRFTFEQEGLKKGTVFVSFRVSDARGAQSQWSKPVEIKIVGNSFLGIDDIIASLGPEIAIGLGVLVLLLIIFITRMLTRRALFRQINQ